MIFAPPGSGYQTADDEESKLPASYEPMMEFPGTMRPGRTPENAPFHDLPIGDDDPDPVPWPHFQQIEWHHKWDPPHPHPIPIEDFIELQGRWATPEMEAAMRAGARRDVKERREAAEADKQATTIMDDDEDDAPDAPVDLGEGVFGQLGSTAEEAITAAAVAPPGTAEAMTVITDDAPEDENDSPGEAEAEEEEDDFDDFLLDLGLDADIDDADDEPAAKATTKDDGDDAPALSTTGGSDGVEGLMGALKSVMAMDESEKGDSGDSEDDDDLDLLTLGLLDDGADGAEGESPADIDFRLEDDVEVDDEVETANDGAVDLVPLDDFDEEEDADFDGDSGGDVW